MNPEDDLGGAGVGSRGYPKERAEGLPYGVVWRRPCKHEDQKTTQKRRGEGKGEGDGMGEGSTDTKNLRRMSYL